MTITYSDMTAIAMQNARVAAGLVGDDLDEKKGMDAFSRSSMLARDWIGGGGGSTSWNEMNLGYSQAGMVISVTAGFLWFATEDPITIAASEETLPETVQDVWIYVKHEWGSAAATIESDITSPAYPTDDTDYMRWPLTCWTVTETDSVYSATRKYLSHVGDIKIPLVRPT